MKSSETLPHQRAVWVLGICANVFGFFFLGFVLGLIGLQLAKPGRRIFRTHPTTHETYKRFQTAWMLCVSGTISGILFTLYWIVDIQFLGGMGFKTFLKVLEVE